MTESIFTGLGCTINPTFMHWNLSMACQMLSAKEIVTARVSSGFVFPSKLTFSNLTQVARVSNSFYN